MPIKGLNRKGMPVIKRKPCDVCGRYMTNRPGDEGKNWAKRRRCSPECYYESIRGRKLSEEHKRKLRGRKLTAEQRRKKSEAQRGRPSPKPKGPASHLWQGDNIQYAAAHRRVRTAKGPPGNHKCACGRQAEAWAFRWDRAERILVGDTPTARNLLYSGDPDDYEPMCHRCHKRFDGSRKCRTR